MNLLPPIRLLWVVLLSTLGVFASLLFYSWVEGNMSIPILPIEFGWPWINLAHLPAHWTYIWNSGLILAFGLVHSLTAQESFKRAYCRILPQTTERAFYVVLSGVILFLVMSLWQNTGVLLWAVTTPRWVSLVLFWGILLGIGMPSFKHFDGMSFLGYKQLYGLQESLPSKVIQQGIYRRVRHPLYLALILAIGATPVMSLDRMILLSMTTFYLFFAIPIEERKLIRQFGQAYKDYRQDTPTLFPRLFKS